MTHLSRLWLLATLAVGGSGCFASAELWLGAPAPPRESVVVVGDDVTRGDVSHVSVFYDELASWGVWQQDPELGWIWTPSDADYVPYRDGSWVDTDAGPTWVAEEPYGWAVTHYGRWLYRDRWYWVPGIEWAPAWVEWRVGEGMVGWAPLGPDGSDWPVPVAGWSFVGAPDFYTRGLAMRRASASYAGWFLYRTRPWVRWATHDGSRRYIVGPRVEIGGHALVERVRLGSLAPESVRWTPRWQRPGIPRHWASVRAGRDGPSRMQRAGPSGPAAVPVPPHHDGPWPRRWHRHHHR
ncbi:MAG: DUF6600 domain-containing protein [Myxococcota bacterium]